MNGLDFQSCPPPRQPFTVLAEIPESEHGQSFTRLEIVTGRGVQKTYRRYPAPRGCRWTQLRRKFVAPQGGSLE